MTFIGNLLEQSCMYKLVLGLLCFRLVKLVTYFLFTLSLYTYTYFFFKLEWVPLCYCFSCYFIVCCLYIFQKRRLLLHLHHHVHSNIGFPCLHWWRFLNENIQGMMSLDMSLLTFFSSRLLLIISLVLLGETTTNYTVLDLLDQAFTSIYSKRASLFTLLSCKHSLMLFNFSLVLNSSAEILSSGLMLHIHFTILA